MTQPETDRASQVSVARTIVLRQLTAGPRSRHQLAEALRRRDCPDDVAVEVLDRMETVGLVDDNAYAAELVRAKQEGRGLAKRALVHELRRKGVDDTTAEEVLAAVDPSRERDRARELAAKKLRTMHGLDAAVQTRRLAGMLARKGYDPDTVRAIVNEVITDSPEHRPD